MPLIQKFETLYEGLAHDGYPTELIRDLETGETVRAVLIPLPPVRDVVNWLAFYPSGRMVYLSTDRMPYLAGTVTPAPTDL